MQSAEEMNATERGVAVKCGLTSITPATNPVEQNILYLVAFSRTLLVKEPCRSLIHPDYSRSMARLPS